jgi:hypothetical protein
MAVTLPKKEPEAENTWREKRQLHPNDVKLRFHGFRIHSRPRLGEAIWQKDGALFCESRALESLT